MFGLILVIHVVVCFVLIGVILIHGGRGGLSETLSGGTAQSLFGSSVANVMTRLTAGCAVCFVVTCLVLAYLSTMRGRSVIDQIPQTSSQTLPFVPPAEPFGSRSGLNPEPSRKAESPPVQPSAPIRGSGPSAVPATTSPSASEPAR